MILIANIEIKKNCLFVVCVVLSLILRLNSLTVEVNIFNKETHVQLRVDVSR
jgi:hypothetical protein